MVKVLVVDDYATNGMIVKQALGAGKYEVKTVTSGEQALAYLDLHPEVGIVLLDINMPDMDGLQTLKYIRSRKRLSDLPVIFLSGAADKERVLSGFREGIDDVLCKPVNPKLLKERLDRALDGESPIQLHKKAKNGAASSAGELNSLYDNLMNDFAKTAEDLASGKYDDDEETPLVDTGTFGIDIDDILGGDKLW